MLAVIFYQGELGVNRPQKPRLFLSIGKANPPKFSLLKYQVLLCFSIPVLYLDLSSVITVLVIRLCDCEK